MVRYIPNGFALTIMATGRKRGWLVPHLIWLAGRFGSATRDTFVSPARAATSLVLPRSPGPPAGAGPFPGAWAAASVSTNQDRAEADGLR